MIIGLCHQYSTTKLSCFHRSGYSYTSPTGQRVNELSFVRDSQGRITAVNNAAGETLVTYTYDQNGDLTQSSVLQTAAVTDSNGNIITPAVWDVTNYTYLQGPQAHIINKITSPSGSTPIINQYDSSGRLISSTDSNGNTITYNPNIAGNQEVVTDRNGNQTVYVYDNQGRVVDQTDPQGHETIYVYGDSWTNNPTTVTTDTLVNGVATNVLTKTYTYDLNGNQLSETYTIPAAGNDPQQTVATYSTYTTIAGRQLLLTSTDANGTVTTNSYDPNTGNLIETDVTDSAGNLRSKTTFGNYNTQGLAGTITQYDDINAAGQLTPGIFTPYSVTQMFYDATGDVTETDIYSADPTTGAPLTLLRKTTFTYDGSGNQTYSITWNTSQPTYPAGVTPPALPTGTPTSVTVNGVTWYPYAVTQSIYDAQNRLIESIDAQGNTTKTLYNLNGQVSQTIDARGLITQNNYDSQGQLASTISDLGTSEQTTTGTTYDPNGNVITSTDQFGNVTKSLYDSNNNLIQTLYPDGTSTETYYNSQGLPQYTTDRHVIGQSANGTETIYDAAGRVIGTDRVSGLVITVSTNAAGVASATVTNSGTVVSTTSQILNAAGQVLSSTGPDGQTTTFTYNALGQQTGSTLPNGGTASTVYDALGRKVSQTDPNGLKTSYIYDAAGDLVQTIYASGTSTSATYDGVGNKTSSTDQMNQITTYSYNVAGQILSVTEPAVINPATGTLVNPVTTYSYDQFGDEVSSTSPNGNVTGGNPAAYTTTYTFDQFGNQTSKTLPAPITGNLSPVTSSTYDSFGRTLTTTDADGQVTLYVYDNNPLVPAADRVNLGRLYGKYYFATTADYQAYIANPTGTTQPNETIAYAYNALGLETSITDTLITPAAGDPRSPYTNVTTFAYDSNNNVIQESGPSGTINYVYDLATQRHTETWTGTNYANAVSDIKYGYNSMGELASVTVLKENGQTPAAVAGSTQYNATGGTSTTNLPNTIYTYDLGGRLSSTFDSATGITTTYTYKPNTNYVQEVKTTNSAGTVLADDSYTYRADGLKTGAVEYTLNANGSSDTVTLTWNYDALDRLTSETSSDTAGGAALNYTDNYQYDLNSNRVGETEKNGSGTVTDTINSTYNADNELTQSVDANNGTTTYQYDNNGSQIGTASPIGTSASEYTLQGKLAGIQNKNGAGTVTSSATYIYDDQGNRIEVTTITGTNSPVTTYYLVDGNNPTGYAQVIEQSSTPGTPTITYIWGGSLIEQDNAAGTANAGTYYLITDGQGSTQVLVNSSGSVVQTYNYGSSGNALGFTPSSAITEYLYNQQYYDVISGQYYFRARNYDPATGTFTQQDSYTINPGDLANANLYLYTGADPINFNDPSGYSATVLGQLVHVEIEAMYKGSHPGNQMLLNAMMPGSFGWLFPDIMDKTLGQIAEIKPFSTYGVSTGPVQLGAYLRAANGLPFSWRGHTGPIPRIPNGTGGLWGPSTWRIGVVPLEIPEAPDTTVYTLGNFGGIIFYKAFTNDRVPILIEQDAKNLANSLEDVMRNFAGAFDTGLQVGGGLVTALNYELDTVFNNDMALYAAEAGALTVSTMIGIGLFQDLSVATLTAQLGFA